MRDKKGRPIKDLKPEELTITDSGTKQSVTGFRLVQGTEAITQTGARTVLDPLRQFVWLRSPLKPWASPMSAK